MANLSITLKDLYAAQQEQALAELKSAYDKNVQAIDEKAAVIPAEYEAAKNEVAVQNAIAKKNFNEQAAATGLNTGTSGQAELARSNAYMSALSNLNRGEAEAQQALQRDRLSLQTDYENAIAAQKAATNSALQNALYQQMLQGGGSGSGSGSGDVKTSDPLDGYRPEESWAVKEAKRNGGNTTESQLRYLEAMRFRGQISDSQLEVFAKELLGINQ